MNDPKPSLDELLARMPRDIPPSRNLWTDISSAIERRPRRIGMWAMAASVAAICLTGGLTLAIIHGMAVHSPDSDTRVARTPNRVPNRGPNFDEPRNPAYLAARAELESSFKERLAILDPKTRAKVEASLAVIQQANEDMRRALEAQPSNPVLEGLLESTWQDEFDLYDDVVRNTQPAMLRS
jgi:hypothetical protein